MSLNAPFGARCLMTHIAGIVEIKVKDYKS